jgi:hypothetical protein
VPTLSTYITQTQRLLHDANATFYSTAELTDYINAGRRHVALDTACLRVLETVTLASGVETNTLSTLSTKGTRAIDLLNVTVLWGNSRIPLQWASFTQFNAYFRTWQTNQSRPAVWSNFGTGSAMVIYIQPVPDQDYTAYLDLLYIPADLTSDQDADEIVYPYSDAVSYYAAKEAKVKEQNYGESAVFEQKYKEKAAWAISQSYTRRLPDPYGQFGA